MKFSSFAADVDSFFVSKRKTFSFDTRKAKARSIMAIRYRKKELYKCFISDFQRFHFERSRSFFLEKSDESIFSSTWIHKKGPHRKKKWSKWMKCQRYRLFTITIIFHGIEYKRERFYVKFINLGSDRLFRLWHDEAGTHKKVFFL